MTVREAFEQEQPKLLSLPDNHWPTNERIEVKIGKTPYARFDKNDYSLPYTHVRKTLTLTASLKQVRILDGQEELAVHPRSFDKGQQIEDPEHIKALIERKSKARKHRGQDHLIKAVPQCRALLDGAALRGDNLGSITSTLLRLLKQYGANELTMAVDEALKKQVPHPNAVRQSLQRRREERMEKPPLPVSLPDDERVREIQVKTHTLDDYDQLGQHHEPSTSIDETEQDPGDKNNDRESE